MRKFGQGLIENVEQVEIQKICQYIKEIMDMQIIQDAPFFYEQLQRSLERIMDQSFRIAVVGEFSSGKSTFINALLGRDILKHGALETTATITEIENNSDKRAKDYFEVYFEDGSIKSDDDINRILEYTTTKSGLYEVAKEIKKVVIHSSVINTNRPLIFVDTPGLNGVADNHREKTMSQIERAHSCIYLIPVRGLGDSDIEFINHILEFQQDIIFVQNFIDEFKESEGESVESKLKEQNEIIKNKILSDPKVLRYKIVGVSSKLALMAKDDSVLRQEGMEVSKEVKDRYLTDSCWESVQQVLECAIEENSKNRNQIVSAIDAIINILLQLKSILLNRTDIEKQIMEKSSDREILNKVNQLKYKLIESKNKRGSELKNFAISEGSKLARAIKKKIEDCQESGKEETLNQIRMINNIDDFDDGMDRIIDTLYTKANNTQFDINRLLNFGYQNILEAALIKVFEYNAVEINSIKADFTAKNIKFDVTQFIKEENSISREKQKLVKEEFMGEELKKKRVQYEKDIDNTKNIIKNNEQYIVSKNSEKQKEIFWLGSEPDLGTKMVTETYMQKRSILFNWLLGEKEKTRQVQVVDDTSRRIWNENRARIDRKYNEEIKRVKIDQSKLNSKLEELQSELNSTKFDEEALRKRIDSTKRVLENKIMELEEKKRLASREYLENQKRNFSEQISIYFDETRDKLIDNMRESYRENMKVVEREVEKIFEAGFELSIKNLENTLKNSELKASPCEETLRRITIIIENLERYVKAYEGRTNSNTK